MRLAAIESSKAAVWEAFNWLVDLLGWNFDESKDSPMAQEGPFLGLIESLQCSQSGYVTIQPKPQWLAGLVQGLQTAVETKKLCTGTARSIQGKLLHFSAACEGKVARGQVHAFKDYILLQASELTPQMFANLRFHLALIEMKPWKIVNLASSRESPIVIYTDAACEEVNGVMQVSLCFVALASDWEDGGRTVVDQSVLDSMDAKKTYISHGEAFAPLFALTHIGPKLRNRSVLWFIDNLGVLSCYCKGSSATADIACIVHASLLMMAALKIRSWYEHVDSKANLSDGGTRGQSKAGSVVLRSLSLPQWPKHTAAAEPAVWLNWFRKYQIGM